MQTVIIMDENKRLHKNVQTTIYVGENNADEILVLMPTTYGGIDIKSSFVTLNMVNQEGASHVNLLEFLDVLYNERYLQAIIPITLNYTYMAGNIDVWLEVYDENELLLKTNEVSIVIDEHKEISDFIPEQTLGLFNDYIIRMEQINNTCDVTLDAATEKLNQCTEIANLMIQMMREWEEKYGSTN